MAQPTTRGAQGDATPQRPQDEQDQVEPQRCAWAIRWPQASHAGRVGAHALAAWRHARGHYAAPRPCRRLRVADRSPPSQDHVQHWHQGPHGRGRVGRPPS
eukprot:7152359-Prymnesium_polylepis.1